VEEHHLSTHGSQMKIVIMENQTEREVKERIKEKGERELMYKDFRYTPHFFRNEFDSLPISKGNCPETWPAID